MPAYNVERFVHQAIETILQQTYANLELLVINDASKDNTLEIIHSFKDPRLKVYSHEKNLGYLKTSNRLFDLAQGEFIAFQDADDYTDPVRLEVQMKEFVKDPGLAVCGTNLTAVKANGEFMFCSCYDADQKAISGSMLKNDYPIIPNSFLFKREVLDTVGKYNEFWDRIGAEDYYWTWLIMEKYKLINISPALYYYRYNPHGVTGDWSDNRRKLHTIPILNRLLKQRADTGTDDLERGDLKSLHAFTEALDKPYRDDASLFYRELARRDFYGGNRERALKHMVEAMKKKPFKLINYRNYFYYLRTQPRA